MLPPWWGLVGVGQRFDREAGSVCIKGDASAPTPYAYAAPVAILGVGVKIGYDGINRLSTYTARSLTELSPKHGLYVATEFSPKLGRYVATELYPKLSRYAATEHVQSFAARPQKGPSLRSCLNPHRNAFRFVSIGVSVEILRRKQVGLFLACFHSLCSDLSELHSLHSNLSGLRKLPVRPHKGPPLGSLLNPHRNDFRFISIGVTVEILRRKQVGLFLACFHSLRSDLSDLHSLHSDLPQKGPPLRSRLNPHRNAFRFVSIRVSVEILRRKQVGLFLACFHSLRSDLINHSAWKPEARTRPGGGDPYPGAGTQTRGRGPRPGGGDPDLGTWTWKPEGGTQNPEAGPRPGGRNLDAGGGNPGPGGRNLETSSRSMGHQTPLSIVLGCTCGRSQRIRSLIGDISPGEWAIILDPMQRRGRHASMGICLVSSCTLDSDDLEVDNQKEPPCRT
ncbi:hypothetical protein F2Q69_00043063 [Brassica cretica]|uniref:Uncharacterized protein n=1 Tax=Brassica cretica TaxID=69181 RepID=A0A8S9NKH3_BRACR|nr:hypothetical protein F2Q69_00043063 [Brassica cretica]